MMLKLLIVAAAWQLVVPVFFRATSRALTIWQTSKTAFLFIVSEGTPRPTHYAGRALLRLLGVAPLPVRMMGWVGHYVVESADSNEPRYRQDYYYLNLLNGRSVAVIKQTPPPPRKAKTSGRIGRHHFKRP